MNLTGCRTSDSLESHAGHMPAPECIYVIGSAGSSLVKIGRTANIANRLAALQRMSPVQLTVMWTHTGGHELETYLHRCFRSRRCHGEWFDFESEDPVQSVRVAVEIGGWLDEHELQPLRARGPSGAMQDRRDGARVVFGRALRNLRETSGLSVRGLAKYAHVHYSRISRAENGLTLLSLSAVHAIDRVLHADNLLVALREAAERRPEAAN